MGGRGAKGLQEATPGGGGGRDGDDGWSTTPDFRSYSNLKQAIGTKGKSMGIEAAAKGANPYYNRQYREFSENCQRSVIAYELRRRGYNVTAQPTYKGDVLPADAVANGNGYWQGAFKGGQAVKVKGTTAKAMQNSFEKKIKSYGNNSRSTLAFGWKGRGHDGHVINVEVQKGKVHYIDAQIGKRYDGAKLFREIVPGTVTTMRTDNLRISERAKKSVEQSKRRKNKR